VRNQGDASDTAVDEFLLISTPRNIMSAMFMPQGIPCDSRDVKPCVDKLVEEIARQLAGLPPHGEGENDCFVNYRAEADEILAEKLYDKLKHASSDKECLRNGEDWKEGFLNGLKSSRSAVISSKGLERCRDATRDHTSDNVLLEYQKGLAINEATGRFIIPVPVGSDFNTALYPNALNASGAEKEEAVKHAKMETVPKQKEAAKKKAAAKAREAAAKEAAAREAAAKDAAAKRTMLAQATSDNSTGTAHYNKGEYAKAIEFHEKCLANRLKVLGAEHVDVATSYYSIGLAHYSKGEYAKAIEFHEKCLAIWLKVMGAEHADVATSYYSIGLAHYSKGDYATSLEFYEKCLAIRLKVLGAEHVDVATSYYSIGAAHYSKGEYTKAIEFYEKSLTIRLKVLGAEHADTKNALAWLNYSKTAKEAAASQAAAKGEAEKQAMLAQATSDNSTGLAYHIDGEYAKAIEFYKKCLAIRRKVLGAEHADVVTSYSWIGEAYRMDGEYAKAIEFHEKCLVIQLKVLGAEHVDVATSYSSIGLAHSKKSEHVEAIEFHEKCLAIRLKVLGAEHKDVAWSYYSIGLAEYNKGEYTKAIEFFEKSLNIRLKVLGAEHADTKHTQAWLNNSKTANEAAPKQAAAKEAAVKQANTDESTGLAHNN